MSAPRFKTGDVVRVYGGGLWQGKYAIFLYRVGKTRKVRLWMPGVAGVGFEDGEVTVTNALYRANWPVDDANRPVFNHELEKAVASNPVWGGSDVVQGR